ncbi:MAG: EVE domain-containing protein [Candidatus Liptonbacteria bacterium]|nr:EVE domain-containing protein [Candidatus Liptonbacteria bacterium]
MKYYLNLFSPETLDAFNKNGKVISGFRIRHTKVASKIKPGDKFVCYVTGESRWVGILEVKSKSFQDKSPVFFKRNDPFIVRFRVKPLIWLDLRHAIPIHEPELWNKLSFTKGQKENSSKWTGKLRGSLIKMHVSDASILRRVLKRQKRKKEVYPLKSEKASEKSTRDIGNELHDGVEQLMIRMGLNILKSDYNAPGPDIIVNDPSIQKNTRILIQCKKNTGRIVNYPSVHKLVREYASWVREEKAALAILVLSGYRAENIDPEFLKKNRVLIWTDGFIESYKKLSQTIGKFAKYQFLSDVGLNYEFGPEIKFDAFKVSQNNSGIQFYVFKANPDWLLKSVAVLRRVDWGSEVRGYQRILERARLNKLLQFFERDDWSLPNTLIFSLNSKVTSLQNTFREHKLSLPSIYGSLWIMDGQHRLYSFSKTDEKTRKENELVCVLFNAELLGPRGEEKQANVFIDINMNVKKVSTSLLLELMQEFKLAGVEYQSRRTALDVVTKLSSLSIFKDLISGYSRKGGSISLTTFVTNSSMTRLLSPNGPILKNYRSSGNGSVPVCFNYLKQYFSIVADVFSEEWGNAMHALSSDKGVRGLLRLLIHILERKGSRDFKSFTKKTLTALRDSSFDFTNTNFRNQFAGEGGANELTDEWLELIGGTVTEFSSFRKKDVEPSAVPKEEDDFTEFKSTLRWNLIAKKIDSNLEHSVLKTVDAFLNTEGGQLFIGVNDGGKVLGLKSDLITFKNGSGTRDDFRLHLSGLMRSCMGESVMDLVRIKFGKKNGEDFCLIQVDKSSEKIFLNNEFYYRSSASSVPLVGQELIKYISRHWKNK